MASERVEAGRTETFKQVMRGVAGTVAIVTAAEDGKPVGMAATSFCSVSMDPPSLLICVNQSASMLRAIRESGKLCVNILRTEARSVCSRFGGSHSQGERFAAHSWKETASGLPFLEDAQAVIACEVAREVVHGTHVVFIANVEEIVGERPSPDPLLYVDGRYARAVPLAA